MRDVRYLILSLFLMVACPVNAQWTATHEITDFSKMMNSHVNPFLVNDGVAIEARNVRANVRIGTLSKRNAMVLYGDAGSFATTGLHKYYQTDDDKFVIASGSTFLKSDSNGDRNFVTIRDELTDGARFTFQTYKNKAIMCNGTEQCQKYDGHTSTGTSDGDRTPSILTADLGAPFAEIKTGTDLDASSWYAYKIQFDGATANYYSNAESNPILTGASAHNIYLIDIPLGVSGTTARHIYRTEGQVSRAALSSATFKFVGTISDDSTTYTDSVPDGSLTTTWSEANRISLTPPIGKFVLLHKERLWIANNPDYTSDIYWSYSFKPDIFHPNDYEPIREEDGDEITGIFNQLGVLAISKTNSWMKFSTISSDASQWQVLGSYSPEGIQAPYASAQSPLGVVFASKDGIYVYNGESAQLISDIVTTDLRDVLWTNRERFVGVYYTNEYHLAYTSRESGSSVNDRVLVLDMERDAYVIDDKNISSFEIFDSGTDEGGVYSGSSLADGEIFANNQETENLLFKTKSGLELWTADDIRIYGTETNPYFELGWTESLDATTLASTTLSDYATAILARPDTDGTLTSPAIEVLANAYDKLYWNEDLNSAGDVTFQIRSASTEAGITGASWSTAVTNPSGSDISVFTENDWVQIRANLSTTDITKSPKVINTGNFNVKFVYDREGVVSESSVDAVWESGMMAFGEPRVMKRLWEIEIMYEGTEGQITFDIEGLDDNINNSFVIDLTVDPDLSDSDEYVENSLGKTYLKRFTLDEDVPIDYYFKYKLTDSSVTTWSINKIISRFSMEDVI